MKKGKTYKVCSTCINFSISRSQSGNEFYCSRLGFETKPHYSFNCWHPKRKVRDLMNRLEKNIEENTLRD